MTRETEKTLNNHFGRKAMTGAVAAVAALLLASCSTAATTATSEAPAAPASAVATTEAPVVAKITAYPVSDTVMERVIDDTPAAKQAAIANAWDIATSKSGYLMSGDWKAAGSKGEDLAALWANYLSPRLLDELKGGKSVENVASYSLTASDSTDDVRAHSKCVAGTGYCDLAIWNDDIQGLMMAGGEIFDMSGEIVMEAPAENITTRKYNMAIPVSTDAGDAYQSSVLDSTLTFIPNDGPAAAQIPYLIDTVVHKVSDQKIVKIDDPKKTSVMAAEKPMY